MASRADIVAIDLGALLGLPPRRAMIHCLPQWRHPGNGEQPPLVQGFLLD